MGVSRRPGSKRRIYVRWPPGHENLEKAQRLYDSGVRQGHGVGITGLCLIGDTLCCYVDIPKNDEEADYMMLPAGELKLSIPAASEPARAVGSRLLWMVLAALLGALKKDWSVADVPSRNRA